MASGSAAPLRRREEGAEAANSLRDGGNRAFSVVLVLLLALGIWIVAPSSPADFDGRRAAALTAAEEEAAVLADLLKPSEVGGWEEEEANGVFDEGTHHQRRRTRATVMRNGKRSEAPVPPSEFTPAHMRAAASLAERGFLWAPVAMEVKATDEESRIQYCRLNLTAYHAEPWLYPMARQWLEVSGCTARGGVRTYTLSSVRAVVEAYPEEFLEPTALLFHETRCGSTLAANMLAAVPTNLVHSEAAVTVQGLAAPGISPLRAVDVTRLVMRAMSPKIGGHTHSFFKLQSSRFVRELAGGAWPKAPWVYFFRDPLEVMVSNLKGQWMRRSRGGEGGAYLLSCPCVRGVARERVYKARRRRPELAGKPLQPEELVELKLEDACREHLDGLNSRALCQLSSERAVLDCPTTERGGSCPGTRGVAVEYSELPGVFTEHVYPDHFGMRSAMEADPGGHLPHMLRAADHYSKQTSVGNATKERELEVFQVDELFKTGMDQGTKAAGANERMRAAAAGMCASYHTLRLWQRWHASSSSYTGVTAGGDGYGAPPGPACGPDVDAATALAWGDLGEIEMCPRAAEPGAAWRKIRERRKLLDARGSGGSSGDREALWGEEPESDRGSSLTVGSGGATPLWPEWQSRDGESSSSSAASWGSSDPARASTGTLPARKDNMAAMPR